MLRVGQGRRFFNRNSLSNIDSAIQVLFQSGEQGAWYDPSDLNTLFQDSAGTTPVTAVEQPVGKILDKSGRGNHATQATAASRPVLSARVNQYLATAALSTQNITTVAASYTLSFAGAGTITLSGTATGVYSAGTHTITCTAGTLTSTVVGSVTTADLRVANDGVGLPAYQRVNTATDYNTVGFPYYLKCDGVDDGMATASIDFTATDKMTVVAGVRKLSDAAQGVFMELSGIITNPGSVGLYAPGSANTFQFASGGSSFVAPTTTGTYPAPISKVVSAIGDISGDIATLRINGTQAASSSADQGLGNFGNYPLYLFRRSGISLPLNGRFYGLVVRGAQSSDAQIASAENYMNSKTKAFS